MLTLLETSRITTPVSSCSDFIGATDRKTDSETGSPHRVDANAHLSQVFIQPKFDVADFKHYFPKDDYEALVREYYNYTRGTTRDEKVAFLKQKLLGAKVQNEAQRLISDKLAGLYDKVGIKPGQEAKVSQLFGPITPEEHASLSNLSRKER